MACPGEKEKRIARSDESEREKDGVQERRESLRLPKEFSYLETFIIRAFAWRTLPCPRLQSTRVMKHDSRADFVGRQILKFRKDDF